MPDDVKHDEIQGGQGSQTSGPPPASQTAQSTNDTLPPRMPQVQQRSSNDALPPRMPREVTLDDLPARQPQRLREGQFPGDLQKRRED